MGQVLNGKRARTGAYTHFLAGLALVRHGATGVLYKYEQGTGRIEALQFLLQVKEQEVAFSLPVHWQRFQRVLQL